VTNLEALVKLGSTCHRSWRGLGLSATNASLKLGAYRHGAFESLARSPGRYRKTNHRKAALTLIVITGAAGFIGSCLLAKFSDDGAASTVMLVDDFSRSEKTRNYSGKPYRELVPRGRFLDRIRDCSEEIDQVVHLGARTDTTSEDRAAFFELNFRYSQRIWEFCADRGIPLVYASSAATYGAGALGYSDDHQLVPRLEPLNEYAKSKQAFDCWALEQTRHPPRWAGLKFFNVYGPNEYHKAAMASVVLHAYEQMYTTGTVRLFKSYRRDCLDGEQRRDFVYVKDVVDVLSFFLAPGSPSGIFNVGTGQPRSFNELVAAVGLGMNQSTAVEYVDLPATIRERYQYFTQADIRKLRRAGYMKSFTSLEDGVSDYVRSYLQNSKTW
jgi:ADP-L-glycero-D-manno-heptose 6-epimerase